MNTLPFDVIYKVLSLADENTINICKSVSFFADIVYFQSPIFHIKTFIDTTTTLELFTWAFENGLKYTSHIIQSVVSCGNLPLLEYIREKGYLRKADLNVFLCQKAAEHGYIHILEWLRKHKCGWDSIACQNAAMNGHLDVLQWLRNYGCSRSTLGKNKCPWDEWTCALAALNGHLHILQWARQNGCPWDSTTCSHAARGGHLHILQWARANGCPWDRFVSINCLQYRHLHILQWADENGYANHDIY